MSELIKALKSNIYTTCRSKIFIDDKKLQVPERQNIYRLRKGKKNLDVIWYNISDRSSFCSNLSCIVANPMRRGSRSPTRQLLISNPFFCLGFISVGLASNNRSFKAPTRAAYEKFVLIGQKDNGLQ